MSLRSDMFVCVCVCICVCMCVFNSQAFPPAVLHPLPKRQALEKSNGASAVFNPSFLHYQQALASAQLQQHASFIPTGKFCLEVKKYFDSFVSG